MVVHSSISFPKNTHIDNLDQFQNFDFYVISYGLWYNLFLQYCDTSIYNLPSSPLVACVFLFPGSLSVATSSVKIFELEKYWIENHISRNCTTQSN